MSIYDIHYRLEPRRPESHLDSGFRAEVADPAWFLARQWQLAEHQGEDAGSPVSVQVVSSETRIDPYEGNRELDPTVVPAEAIIESEPTNWWTLGRRARIGAAGAALLPRSLTEAERAELRFTKLTPPYDRLNRRYDGLVLFQRRATLGLPPSLFAGVPAKESPDLWNPAELVYSAGFTAGRGAVRLQVPRHDGGDVDWYSTRATAGSTGSAAPAEPITILPGRLRYPGAPHPRWWQIEDARVDIGGFPPDRSHFATMLLIDLLMSHADDWFTFPLRAKCGTILTLRSVQVLDSFGETTRLRPPEDWSLFRVDGLDPTSLVIWPTAASPLCGPPLDEVSLGLDEDANLLWAVERRVLGRELSPQTGNMQTNAAKQQVVSDRRKEYVYKPALPVPDHWHPYIIGEANGRRRFIQGRLANLGRRPPALAAPPTSPFLIDPKATDSGPVHQIEPATVPTNGLQMERRYVLARRTDGLPVLWLQRQRLPLIGPPVSNLRYDVMEEESVPSAE